MPTDAALDIVNALFAGQKDLSDFVATGMNAAAVDALDAKKKEMGAKLFAPETEEEPESEPEQPEATADQEETTDETDQGRD
jgi:hypothetical protein